jgi:phosphate uptake regulator
MTFASDHADDDEAMGPASRREYRQMIRALERIADRLQNIADALYERNDR